MNNVSPLKVPVILVAGFDADTMAIATMALGWDLPKAVAVRHDLDPTRDTLTRTVSDATGLIEKEELELDHACASCALREDVVPTLERLASSGQWDAIVAQLPATASPAQVCRVSAWDPARVPHVRISAVVAALSDTTLEGDLLGDELLCEVDLPVREDDRRGLAETACALVEYADVVFTPGDIETDGRDLINALMRPGARLLDSVSALDGAELTTGLHHCETSDEWVAEVRRGPLPSPEGEAWVLDVHSDRPFHPDRLMEFIAVLGGGPRRSRGCFWLPTRPHQLCIWNGAGGQLSVGTEEDWGRDESPLTRITVVGLDGGRDALAAAFEACLLTDAEMEEHGPYWEAFEDGFEPWLGPIHRGSMTEAS
ncbi:CobW family GTP-binding protein [Tessaracoccus caeni]|uniref:CobW family GTP-binding protein n=1 Tax=Tessaracoccus caeni TaxID=3031239 RepID=UPI0023DAE027|nr:GTP-binding protein [Tessaracoccus caeni]MDF1489166.1 GTP-binding protein [Tessaracoccus caeni]